MLISESSLIDDLLKNSNSWHSKLNLDESLTILINHSNLMEIYQKEEIDQLNEKEIESLYKVVQNIKRLMLFLEEERVNLIEMITLMNQSEKIATQYIQPLSASYFLDKDF